MSNPYLVDVCILAILNKVAIRVEVATRTCGSNRDGSQARSAATSAESPGKAWTKATNASGTTSGTTSGANSSNSTSTSASRSHKCAVWNSIQIRYLMIFVWYCTAGIGLKQFSNVKDMADSPIGWCHLYSHQIGLWGRQCRPKLWLQCSRCDCDEHGKTTTTQVTGKPVASPLHVRFGVGAYAM